MVGKRQDDLEGDLFPRGAASNATPRVQKRNGQTLFGPQLKRRRTCRPTESSSHAVLQHGALLSLSRLSVGMTVLGLVVKADRSGIELVLPGGLRGAVGKNEFLVDETPRKPKIVDSDDDSSTDSSDEDVDSIRPAWEVVSVGNIVTAAVVDIETNDYGKKVVKLSLKPHLVNVGLNPSFLLSKNFSAYGAIKSAEDHGYVISFGANIPHTAFLPFEKEPKSGDRRLVPGAPIMVVTTHDVNISKKHRRNVSSSVRVSALQSEVLKAAVDAEGMTYQDLQAGMLLRCRILQQGPGGVSLSALGIFNVDVDASHVPWKADLTLDMPSGNNVFARLLYVDPSQKRIGASLLDSFVTDLSPRAVPPHWNTGTRLKALRVERVESGFGLLLRYIDRELEMVNEDEVDMQEAEGEEANRPDLECSVPIFAHISRISDSKELNLESRYRKNSVIKDGARVVSVSRFDGVINVDLRASVLQRKVLSLDEVEVGTVYDCKILSHTSMGSLMVAVDGDPYLPGIVLPAHISDVPIPSKRLAKNPAFRIGSSVKCRALQVKWGKRKVLLTARKSLVSPKYPMLTSYDQAREALKERKASGGENVSDGEHARFTGITKAVTRRGSLLVDFCDSVMGLVPAAELCVDHARKQSQPEIERLYPIGETVHVRLLKVDPKTRRMLLSMSLEAQKERTGGRKAFQLGQRVKATFSSVDTDARHFVVIASAIQRQAHGGESASGVGRSPRKAADRQNKTECRLPFGHLSDNMGVAERLASELQLRLKGPKDGGMSDLEIPEAMVLCYREDVTVLTVKTSLITAADSDRLPKSFDEIQLLKSTQGETENGFSALRGYVKALLPSGAIIGFLGECVGFVRNSRVADRFVSDPARSLKMHQSVSAIVESVDESNRRFSLSMRPSDIGRTGMEADTLSLFRSLEPWQMVFGLPRMESEFQIGGVVTASVSSVSTFGVKYDLMSQNRTAVGVAYGATGTAGDVVLTATALEFSQSPSLTKALSSKSTQDLALSTVERVRVLDVDPLTSVVDLSRDEKVVSQGEKKSVISAGASFGATILLVKSAYVILAVKRSKSRTTIAYALGPVTQEDLLIRPGAEVNCVALDKTKAKTRRNLVLVDWESFRSTRKDVRLKSTKRDSEFAKAISVLQASANLDNTGLVGLKIRGKVSRKFTLRAYLGIAPGIVGQIHITNTSFVTPEELSEMTLGVAAPRIASRFMLPEVGKNVKVAYIAGLRRAADATPSDPVVVEVSLCKERCSTRAPCVGERVLGFVKRPSFRLTGVQQLHHKQEVLTQTLVATSPTSLISCADVDCLFNDNVTIQEGTPVICQVTGLSEDGTSRARGTISSNGESKSEAFLGLVQSVHPGRGLRVSIPWHARDAMAKFVTWGYVDICDVSNDFDKTANFMKEVQPGSIVKIYTILTSRDIENEGKYRVLLSMRAPGQSKVKDPMLTKEKLDTLDEGSQVRGFVQGIGKKGCFVAIGRKAIAQVRLCDLSDEFVRDLESEFPVGKLVSGRAHKLRIAEQGTRISLVLRKRPRKELRTVSVPSEVKEGSKVCGVVIRVAEYGALIEIASGVTALLHKSEADQDRFINDPREEWLVGQKLTAIVIRVAGGKVNVGTKRCYFEAAGVDEVCIDELLARNIDSKNGIKKQSEADHREDYGAVASDKDEDYIMEVDLTSDSEGEIDARPSEAQDGATESYETGPRIGISSSQEKLDFHDSSMQGRLVPPLEVSGGFNFAETVVSKPDDEINTDNEPGEQRNSIINTPGLSQSSSRDKREKKRLREAAERDIRLREEALANDPNTPETAEDFERLLLGEPNSSVMWIRYMAFCVQLSQIDKARSIAERALETISLHKEVERVNVWGAYVNLEAQFGSMNSTAPETNDEVGSKRAAAVFRVFERACERVTDVENFHLRISSALRQSFPELADDVLQRGLRRFKDSSEIWIALGLSRFTKGETQGARKTLERALITLDKRKHVRLITKFAQFEYKYGNAERGRTVFESLIGNFPKRVDLWNIYLDMEMAQCLHAGEESQNGFVKRTRHLFERFTSLDLNSKKMKFGFKKWLKFEKTYGTKENETEVKNRARKYVNRNVSEAQDR